MSQLRRVIDEIRYKVLRKPADYAALLFYVIATALMYLLYSSSLNRPDPTFGGLSIAYAYSLIIWALIMVSIFFAIVASWK